MKFNVQLKIKPLTFMKSLDELIEDIRRLLELDKEITEFLNNIIKK